MIRQLYLAGAAALVTLTVAGCGGGGNGNSSSAGALSRETLVITNGRAIQTVGANGANGRILATAPVRAFIGFPSISANRRLVAYQIGEPPVLGRSRSNIFVVNTAGGAARALTANADNNKLPAIRPDGSVVAYIKTSAASAAEDGLYLVPSNGGASRLLPGTQSASEATWTLDGQSLIYVDIDDLDNPAFFRIGLNDSAPQKLFELPALELVVGLELSPDGQRLLFASKRDISGFNVTLDVFSVNVGGTDLLQLTDTPDLPERSPTWSPDGTRIAFEQTSATFAIFVADADGQNVRRVRPTGTMGNDFNPDWS